MAKKKADDTGEHAVNFAVAEAAIAEVLYAEAFGYSYESCHRLAAKIAAAIEALPAETAEPHIPDPL